MTVVFSPLTPNLSTPKLPFGAQPSSQDSLSAGRSSSPSSGLGIPGAKGLNHDTFQAADSSGLTNAGLTPALKFGAVSRRAFLLGGLGGAALLVAGGGGYALRSSQNDSSPDPSAPDTPPASPSDPADAPTTSPSAEPSATAEPAQPLRGNYVVDDGTSLEDSRAHTVTTGRNTAEAGTELLDGQTLVSSRSDYDGLYHITSILGSDGGLYLAGVGNQSFAQIEVDGDGAKITIRNHSEPIAEVRKEGDTYRLMLPSEIGGDNPSMPAEGVDATTAAAVLLSAWQPSRSQIRNINRLYGNLAEDLFRDNLVPANANYAIVSFSPDRTLGYWDSIINTDSRENAVKGLALLRLNLQATKLTTDSNPSSRWHVVHGNFPDEQPYSLVYGF
ncbi:MAG: hypothetical protein VKJ04_07550 [Vampirovibrionales bacterium]|nr:hypothetical protein [Vampirovibrionales bacterium]